MDNKRMLHQVPSPEVRIYSPDDGPGRDPKLHFDLSNRTILQGYSFSTSVNDCKGNFSLAFYPDDDKVEYSDDSIIDMIEAMDIVEIYESEKNFKAYPVFVGVIRQKKIVIQFSDAGPKRSFVISGHSIAALVSEFKVSLDLQAMELTGEIANEQQLSIELTDDLLTHKPLSIKTLVEKVWEHFLNLSTKYGKLSTADVAEYITKWMGEDFFQFDESEFCYPLGNIFNGRNTENFFDIIKGIVPKPVFEIFPYTKNGETKIKIRQAPFDMNVWNGELENTKKQIDPVQVKAVDVLQTDNEVYSVYFVYIDGYPIQMDKAIILSAQSVKGVPGVIVDDEKFGRYGYRPYYISLHGYAYSGEGNETSSSDKITELSTRLKEWFCNNNKFYSGTLTMSTDISSEMPQPGEKISFFGGEFYVVAAQHQWNYGGNPETILSITRGGIYTGGSFMELINISKRYQEFKNATGWESWVA